MCVGNSSLTFRDNISVASSRVLKLGPIGRLDRSVRNYHSTLHNNPEDSRSHLPRGGSLKTCTRVQLKEENTLTWFQRIPYKNSCILSSIYNMINNRQIISTIKITVLGYDAVRFGRDESRKKKPLLLPFPC